MSRNWKLFGVYTVVVILSVVTAAYVVSPRRIGRKYYWAIKNKLDRNPRSLFMYDEDIAYRLKPCFSSKRHSNTPFPHRTNSRGLLGAMEISKKDKRKKILFLGDSVAYGEDVPFEKIAISLMQQMAGNDYILANGSCPGWSTNQELKYYKKYLADIHWDAIVIMFCLNDLLNFEWVYDEKTEFRMSEELENIGGLTGFEEKALESIRIWNIKSSFQSDKKLRPLVEHTNTALVAWEKDRWENYNRQILRPFLTATNHPPVIIVAMPTLLQIEALRAGAPESTALFPQHQLKGYCKLPRVAFLNGADAFDAKPSKASAAYLDNDILHLSEEGHQLMADYLWPLLRLKLGARGIN